jgi:hypothetical protein
MAMWFGLKFAYCTLVGNSLAQKEVRKMAENVYYTVLDYCYLARHMKLRLFNNSVLAMG